MGRKVIQLNPTTLAITLPKKWTKDYNVTKGNEVSVEEDESGNLMLRTSKPLFNKTEIALTTKDIEQPKKISHNAVRTILVNALRKGYHEINVTFDTPSIMKSINEVVSEVLGYEIVEQTNTNCTIKNIVTITDTNIDKFFIKFQHMAKHLGKLVYNELKENTPNNEEISSYFVMIERNFNSFYRLIMEDTKMKINDKICFFGAVNQLYQALRNINMAHKQYIIMNHKVNKKTLHYAQEVLNFMDNILQFSNTKQLNTISSLINTMNTLTITEINKLISENSKDNSILMHWSFAARRFWDFMSPYIASIV
tara:strand:- start:1825 stop:2754 length:930 start_codon:yes stop_codon:yes gene_type:complete